MSTKEYYEMFLQCQNIGKYQIFTFDIVNSKKIEIQERNVIQIKLMELIKEMYLEIKKIEESINREILVFDDDFVYLWDNKKMMGFGLKCEPFVLGDMVGFTVYRDMIDIQFVIKLFNELKNKYKIINDFHINTGYYETNDYGKGNELFFRGYCIEIVSNLHKDKYKNNVKKLSLL